MSRSTLERELGDITSSAVVTLIFDRESRFALVADELLEHMPWWRRKNRGHWLCKSLNASAAAVDPETYFVALGTGTTAVLRDTGMPRFAAEVIGKSFAFGAGRLAGSLSTDHLVLVLRVLILLVCPDFDRCPTQSTVCTHLMSPGVESMLRESLGDGAPAT